VRRWIPDLTDEEFARWDQLGLIEHLDIDGERWYFKRAPSNLFLLSDEARARRRADAPMPPPGPNEVPTRTTRAWSPRPNRVAGRRCCRSVSNSPNRSR
jgi:hypothetical protein